MVLDQDDERPGDGQPAHRTVDQEQAANDLSDVPRPFINRSKLGSDAGGTRARWARSIRAEGRLERLAIAAIFLLAWANLVYQWIR